MKTLTVVVEKKSSDLVVLKLKGDFEGVSALEGKQELLSAVRDNASGNILLDLAEVSYIDSMAVGILLEMAIQAAKKNTKLAIIYANDSVKKVLSVTKVNEMVTVFDL